MTEVDEVLDLVNEKDEVIGSTQRKGVHERKDKHRAVQVFSIQKAKCLWKKEL
jgi:isopentenyldiphosphate isomerase